MENDDVAVLQRKVKYLEDCLDAVITGNMPAKATLYQTMLAMRARRYLKWLESKEETRYGD